MRCLTRPRLSATIRLSHRQRPPPRPNLLRRQPTASPAARDGGHGALATANSKSEFGYEKPPGETGRFLFARPLTRGDGGLQIRRIDGPVEIGVQPVLVKFALPPRHKHGG